MSTDYILAHLIRICSLLTVGRKTSKGDYLTHTQELAMSKYDPLVPFGKNLKKVRNELGISQEKLAELSGLDRTYVSVLERGKKNPSLRIIFQLAKGLNIKPKVLLDF